MSSEATSKRSSEEVPSQDIDNEEDIDVQSVVASTGTISVFNLVSESALDDAVAISMASMNSSIQESLIRQSPLLSLRSSRQSLNSPRQSVNSPRQSVNSPRQSVNSPRHSLNLTVQSLNDSQLSYENDGVDNEAKDKAKSRKSKEDKIKEQELRRKDKILCKAQYVMYTLLSIVAALIVMIIWYTSWLENKTITVEIGNEQTDIKASINDSNCQFWDITADGFCDDEANIPECGYDFKDCCQMENDRTVCEDCFCIVPEDDKASIKEKHFERCPLYYQYHLGDGWCDLNQNNEDHYFDFGDCCLEDISCRLKFFNQTEYIDKYCPPNPCIRSNIFCVQEELGNGICEDHNNGPYCDYDLGDCCMKPPNNGPTTTEQHISKAGCCVCSCKQATLYLANTNENVIWG